jgi:hypothetical protein
MWFPDFSDSWMMCLNGEEGAAGKHHPWLLWEIKVEVGYFVPQTLG